MRKFALFCDHKWENRYEPIELTGLTEQEEYVKIKEAVLETFAFAFDEEELGHPVDLNDIDIDAKWGIIKSPYLAPYVDRIDFVLFRIPDGKP